MKFIALKTEDGKKKGRIAFCCKMLGVSRQGFYRYLVNRNRPWKYQRLAEIMREICSEDQCNDTYGRADVSGLRMKKPDGVEIPGEKTVYRIMKKIGLTHHPKRKPNGITKADREAMKSDDLLKRDFRSDEPLKKCITDITEIKAKDGKLYTSVIFDCFDLSVLGIAMSTNMKAESCAFRHWTNAMVYPALVSKIIHSDRAVLQYTKLIYTAEQLTQYGIRQSMNSAGGRCHDNARWESMWAKGMKTELLYDRYDPEQLTVEQLKSLVWRYFMSY